MPIKKYNKKTKKQRGGTEKLGFFSKVKKGFGNLKNRFSGKQSYNITKPPPVLVTNSIPKPNPNPNPKPVLVLNQPIKTLSVNDYGNLHNQFKKVNQKYEHGRLIPKNANPNTVKKYIEHHISSQLQLYNKVIKENSNFKHPNIDLKIKNGKLTAINILQAMQNKAKSENGTLIHHKDTIQNLINKYSSSSSSSIS